MNFFLDFIVIAVIALFVATGFKKGFIYSIVNLLGTAISVVVSSVAGSMLALPIYNSVVQKSIIDGVDGIVRSLPEETTALQTANEVMEQSSTFINNIFTFSGVTSDSLSNEIMSTNLSVPDLVETLVRPYAVRMISTILTILLFVVLTIIVKLIADALTKTIEFVKLGTVNRILGIVFGVAESALVIMVITLMIYFVMMYLPSGMCNDLHNGINQTYLYRYIYQYSMPDQIITQLTLG